MLRAHGSLRKYQNEVIGYNSRLDALQAAFLRVKLPRVDAWNAGRREAARRYAQLLGGLPNIVLPVERPDTVHVYHQFTIRVLGGQRDSLRAALEDAGVETTVYYPTPTNRLPIYAGSPSLPEAESAASEVLSLPFWPRLTREVQEYVTNVIRAHFASR
jgi:dTDP-4-amino-4,6-dideoxygalactose transaminase